MHKFSFVNIIILLITVTIFLGCSNTLTNKYLEVAVSEQMPPYSYYEDNTNDIIGFDIDIADEIAKRLNKELYIEVFDFNRIIPTVASKQVDFGMASMNIVPERQQMVDFTIPYNISRGRFVVVGKIGKKINSIADIKKQHLAIGIRNGTVYPPILKKVYGFTDDDLKIYPNQGDMRIALQRGNIKVAVSDYGAMYTLKTRYGMDIKFIGKPVTEAPCGLTVNKQNKQMLDELNMVLQDMIKDGTYQEIAIKWFGINPLQDVPQE